MALIQEDFRITQLDDNSPGEFHPTYTQTQFDFWFENARQRQQEENSVEMPNSGAPVTGRDGVWNVAVRVACRSGPVLCDERPRLSLASSGGGQKEF